MTTSRSKSIREAARIGLLVVCAGLAAPASGEGPSFSCDEVRPGSIEEIICKDQELSDLDRSLSQVYAAASKKAADEQPPLLKAEQRGWIKGRDECWKSDDKAGCVRDAYRRRIVELQARYRLVPGSKPVTYACDGDKTNEIAVTFFDTDPQTLIAERGDSVSLMYRVPSASGAKYQGRNETLWEKGGKATVTWGYGAPDMECESAIAEHGADYADGLSGGPDYWQVKGVPAGDTLNVRADAGTGNQVVGELANGDTARNLGCKMLGDSRWCRIEMGSEQKVVGWVNGRYLAEAAGAP